ncbi:MAG: type I DNA topoisomerase [Phycisphaeraceae bacterium]|nr:type I DNA topoisomerase [Phycisphaeraceae bacterium]
MAKRPSKKPESVPEGGATAVADAPTSPAKPVGRFGGKGGRGGRGGRVFKSVYKTGSAKGKNLVIVESPAKAKTINRYLGPEYVVLASVGHVRDLPSRNPKGVKNPVPGVDLERDFKPTYVINEDRANVISDLRRAAKDVASGDGQIWFATDLDREGEAIAWHLAQELGITSKQAKRVIFPAITKAEIAKAFSNPHPIDEDRVNAQQARRILDRIVGYQVSPLLWKKVARGLSAGRVQSVAVRLVVEREREIRAFIPDEYYEIKANFTNELAKAAGLAPAWQKFIAQRDDKNNPPTIAQQTHWLEENHGFRAELIEVGGKPIDILAPKEGEHRTEAQNKQILDRALEIARLAGVKNPSVDVTEDQSAKGPAKFIRAIKGDIDPKTPYKVESIETKRTTTRPAPPFITSTLQQAASSRLGFGAQRTMRAAQQLYEGVDIPGEGPIGLITYMRTDSTHLSGEALNAAREYIGKQFGDKYLPEKPNFFSSSNKDAQEAHEAIRPTNPDLAPSNPKIRRALSDDQFRLYELIWQRFVACQMTPAQWDSTTIRISGGTDPSPAKVVTFKTTGRVLIFDGHYKVSGVPRGGEEQTLPTFTENQPLAPFAASVLQKFTSPPPRYSEASLIKVLESEGIGRPSTYASIISVIQERKYVEQQQRRFYATDLGEVVTDKLIEGFPQIMDVGYTREMEAQLDKVEEDHLDWIDMLKKFYGPFKKDLKNAEESLVHAKAESQPSDYKCPTCGKPLVYKFGKNGRFLSCSDYPTCTYASPVDREGKPRPAAETVNVQCPKCGRAMTKRVGRFGPFLGCSGYSDKENPCDGLLNIDKKGKVTAPSQPPLITDLPCPTCEAPLNLRNGVRGPWLGCSRFPKCRGRGKWAELDEAKRTGLEKQMAAHDKANPIPIIKTMDGIALTDAMGKPLAAAKTVDQLSGDDGSSSGEQTLESVADEMGV